MAVRLDDALPVAGLVRIDRRYDQGRLKSPVIAVAVLLTLVGLLALAAVLLRVV
jgi:hypothetical protein